MEAGQPCLTLLFTNCVAPMRATCGILDRDRRGRQYDMLHLDPTRYLAKAREAQHEIQANRRDCCDNTRPSVVALWLISWTSAAVWGSCWRQLLGIAVGSCFLLSWMFREYYRLDDRALAKMEQGNQNDQEVTQ